MKKNLIYFGSPDFSATILESIIVNSQLSIVNSHIVAVVTSPDVPLGRQQIITPSPVAVTAAKYDLPVFKPVKLDVANLSHLKLLKPDLFLVVSYGKIIPQSYLSTPTIGTFNIHFSLLPRYRGALPISEAIKNGDTQTGVTLMVMDEALDHGPIISAQEVTIDVNDDVADLTTKLTQTAITLLTTQLPLITTQLPNYSITTNYLITQLPSSPQDESLATYTPSLKTRTRQSAFIPWEEIKPALTAGSWQPAADLHNLIRSLNPDPGAWTRIPISNKQNSEIRNQESGAKEIELKIIKTKLNSESWSLLPELVQLPGKSPISWESFLSGHKVI